MIMTKQSPNHKKTLMLIYANVDHVPFIALNHSNTASLFILQKSSRALSLISFSFTRILQPLHDSKAF